MTQRPPERRSRYLFVRILEACNADCFMCEYALSRDPFRFSVEDFEAILPQARAVGVEFVRFTGGEPLLHADVLVLIRVGAESGMRMSVITNGFFLPRMADDLRDAGLAQAIVSIDGATAETHNRYRRSKGLFENAVEGLRRARAAGILTRVNSVVGPHNYTEMPELQRVLEDAGVQQWELSSLKLERHIRYDEPADVLTVCDPLYDAAPGRLVPMGKKFYGNDPEEQRLFFEKSITPRASRPLCHLVDDVIYLDAKNGDGYPCSCLPHRDGQDSGGAPMRHAAGWDLSDPVLLQRIDTFRVQGPDVCTGCSSTAAGYSDDVAALRSVPAWHF